MKAPDKGTVLVVDDDPEVAEAHVRLLAEIGYPAFPQSDPLVVERILVDKPEINLVLLDMRMPGLNGLDLLRRVKILRPQVGVVMATVINDIEHAVRAIKFGAYNYLLKPLQGEGVERVLGSYFSNQPRRLIDDSRFAHFITGAPVFEGIFRSLKTFAEADVPVLIEGETGTGKELIARLIHTLSRRTASPYVGVNVAALPSNLFESELFGYRRGAFTGAMADHAGFFESTAGGTLFLDEIGDLEADQQKKLLRVLQERTFRRIGETSERALKARLVLATNRDLQSDVRAGRFREDLYFRLAGHEIRLPPLRERPGDIEMLAEYFLAKYCSQFGRTLEGFSPEAREALIRHPFPGNVRELENAISSAVLLEMSTTVRRETLPHHIQKPAARLGAGATGTMEQAQVLAVAQALKECGGNQSAAAKKLGISRTTVYRILRECRKRGMNI